MLQGKGELCYFQTMKKDKEVQGALSIFRLWQKEHLSNSTQFCHVQFKDGTILLSTQAKQILESNIPILSINDEYIEEKPETNVTDNNLVLSNIIDSIFTENSEEDGIDDTTSDIPMESISPIEENDLIEKGNDLPNRLIQQQLLLLNSLSNRLTWLFTELSQNGISDQITRPHENALNRMINASRDLQVKLQKNIRKVATSPIHRIDSTNIITTQEMEDLEKEKKRLENKLSVVNDKLTFFSNEYQRITELYINEKSKNEQYKNQIDHIDENEKDGDSSPSEEIIQLEKKIAYYKNQVEELEYSLKVLVETGTIIPQELDNQINRVLSGQSLLDLEEELTLDG